MPRTKCFLYSSSHRSVLVSRSTGTTVLQMEKVRVDVTWPRPHNQEPGLGASIVSNRVSHKDLQGWKIIPYKGPNLNAKKRPDAVSQDIKPAGIQACSATQKEFVANRPRESNSSGLAGAFPSQLHLTPHCGPWEITGPCARRSCKPCWTGGRTR